MNITERGITSLLRSAVTGECLPLPEGFELEGCRELIKKHHMAALIYEGALKCGVERQQPVMQQLFKDYCRALMVSEAQLAELRRVYAAFDENGIDYMPLKGSKMKHLYPKPELRYMGDADILIRIDQYDRIKPVMESLGMRGKTESEHEIVWVSDTLYLELHKKLIPSYNKDYSYFGDGWQLARPECGSRWTMSAEDEFVFLFAHFAKHYRDGGIGCRYVLDLWVYLRSNPELNEARVTAELEKLCLLEFYKNIRGLIALWFEDGNSDEKTEYITSFIFSSGSWGEGSNKAIARAARGSGSGKLSYIRHTLFPGVKILEGKYRVLRKAPWLLPFVWVGRFFYKLIFEHRTFLRYSGYLKAVNHDEVEEHRTQLEYVGLNTEYWQ